MNLKVTKSPSDILKLMSENSMATCKSNHMTSRHKLEQFPNCRHIVAKRCNCHYACFNK